MRPWEKKKSNKLTYKKFKKRNVGIMILWTFFYKLHIYELDQIGNCWRVGRSSVYHITRKLCMSIQSACKWIIFFLPNSETLRAEKGIDSHTKRCSQHNSTSAQEIGSTTLNELLLNSYAFLGGCALAWNGSLNTLDPFVFHWNEPINRDVELLTVINREDCVQFKTMARVTWFEIVTKMHLVISYLLKSK